MAGCPASAAGCPDEGPLPLNMPPSSRASFLQLLGFLLHLFAGSDGLLAGLLYVEDSLLDLLHARELLPAGRRDLRRSVRRSVRRGHPFGRWTIGPSWTLRCLSPAVSRPIAMALRDLHPCLLDLAQHPAHLGDGLLRLPREILDLLSDHNEPFAGLT